MSKSEKGTGTPPFEVISIDQIPEKVVRERAYWIKEVEMLPPGKALVTTEKDIGARATSVSTTLKRAIKRGALPDHYRVVRRKEGKTMRIYILNTATSLEEVATRKH